MGASLGLFRLQQIDSHITQIETRLASIQKTLDDSAELQSALSKLRTAEEEQRASERAQHKSEDEAQTQQIKIQQVEASLYGGTVRNPKELQDLQADIVSLKKQLAVLEERQLQDMVKVEAAQSAAAKAQTELSQVQGRLGDEHSQLFKEKESLAIELNRMQSERQAAVSAIAENMLNAYEELRRQRRGIAVAEVSDNACGACGTTLTAAIQQTARHAADLVHCPTCGRILYTV